MQKLLVIRWVWGRPHALPGTRWATSSFKELLLVYSKHNSKCTNCCSFSPGFYWQKFLWMHAVSLLNVWGNRRHHRFFGPTEKALGCPFSKKTFQEGTLAQEDSGQSGPQTPNTGAPWGSSTASLVPWAPHGKGLFLFPGGRAIPVCGL